MLLADSGWQRSEIRYVLSFLVERRTLATALPTHTHMCAQTQK